MSFQYVDQIFQIEEGVKIRGIKNVTRNEPFLIENPGEQPFLNPWIVAEAGMQLGAWLAMHASDFSFRPVLLTNEKTVFLRRAYPGDQIEFVVNMAQVDEQIIEMNGVGWIRGDKIIETNATRGYLVPSGELTNPEDLKRQFHRLYRPERAGNAPVSPHIVFKTNPINDRAHAYLDLLDGVVEFVEGQKIAAIKNFASDEAFFIDHFKNKPIVPGVIQLKSIFDAIQFLYAKECHQKDLVLLPHGIAQTKFRHYLQPGDCIEIVAKSSCNSKIVAGGVLHFNGEVRVDKKTAMKTKMSVRVEPLRLNAL